MNKNTETIRKRYDRASSLYDFWEAPMEKMIFRKWRADLLRELKGKVLEVGVGTGKNIDYYPEGLDVTGIDFSSKMLEKARQKALLLTKTIKLLQMDAEHMTFPENEFDMVFTTCVFCSVPNPVKGLQEIRRVCRNGGKIIMLEHVRSEKYIIGLLMDLLNPLILTINGANINRRTVDNIRSAGMLNIKVTDVWKDIVKKIEILNLK